VPNEEIFTFDMWDIRDKAPVVLPDDGGGPIPTHPVMRDIEIDRYERAVAMMSHPLRMRYYRFMNTIDILVEMFRQSKEDMNYARQTP
jgi:hypothetical protein